MWPPWRAHSPAEALPQLLADGRDLRELWLLLLHCQWAALRKDGQQQSESMCTAARLRAGVEAACDAWARDACVVAAACHGDGSGGSSLHWPEMAAPADGRLVDDFMLLNAGLLP